MTMIKTRFPWSESYLCGMEDGERKWVISMKQQVEPFFFNQWGIWKAIKKISDYVTESCCKDNNTQKPNIKPNKPTRITKQQN